MTVVRFVIRLGTVLVCATGWAALPVTPAGAAPGFNTAITELPGRFVAGRGAETVRAVVSTTLGGDCLKVRWSLVVRLQGVRPNQVEVDRIETGSFPVEVRAEGNGTRLTDRQLDPGSLCRNRTVTAQYRIAVDGAAPNGRITLAVEAFDAGGRLLDRGSATREVTGSAQNRRRTPAPKQTRPSPTEAAPTESVETEAADDESPVLADGSGADGYGEGGGADPDAEPSSAAANGGGIGLTQVGFVGGGVLLFLGVGLLFRLRSRDRSTAETAFAPAAPSRRGRPRYPASYQTPATAGHRRARDVRGSADW
ncbi:hypothetical protein I0C86_29870 [Plantactinospora sp. S1510]|uniref:Uncharacterized protein n=1 Tax=Plantactinospora alkalitolerans TaxID=2789879 RepID=A0ABS0H3U3_9ACTN|nr:hypothetical protein [Plantactinospora alkalitolerans]MBF9133138.1 hypothetical protein [Plantactinospora alkalitolerans]